MAKRILPVLAIVLLSGCSGALQRTVDTSRCVIADDRLGKAITDPKGALDWLKNTKDEILQILVKWKESPIPTDLSLEYALFEDLSDLVTRLMGCIDGGGEMALKELQRLQRRLAKIEQRERAREPTPSDML